jgi:hexokinase
MDTELIEFSDYPKIKESFLGELKKTYLGENTSLSYLKHYLPDKPLVTSGIVQGIVIGGTNYIVSVEEIQEDGRRLVLDKRTGTLPILKDDQTFISFLKEHLDDRALAVGVNFGFPLEPVFGPHGELDGKLITGTKEHKFDWLIGTNIGDTVRSASGRDIPVSVANDTVCLTLAGDGTEDGSMIAGTGFNIGIKQKEGDKTIVINLETGNFDKFEPTQAIKIIDACSDLPGRNLFEKMISGKYLAEVFNIKTERMGITMNKLKTSQELSALSQETANADANKLARVLLERSASMVAASLAAIYEFKASPDSFTVIGEGSLLWKGWNYIPNIEKQLEALGVPQGAIKIKHVQDSSIKGAVALLVQNSL